MKVVIDDVEYVEMSENDFIATLGPAQRYKINGKWYEPKPPEPQFMVGDKVREDKGIGTVEFINQDGQMRVGWEGAYQYSYYELKNPHTFDALRKV